MHAFPCPGIKIRTDALVIPIDVVPPAQLSPSYRPREMYTFKDHQRDRAKCIFGAKAASGYHHAERLSTHYNVRR